MDELAYLFSLEQFGIKFGLDNIRAILARLGHPERAFRSVHIAGTNGKGSVTAMVETVLRCAGHRSARYTSPHLVDLTERFVIDGRAVDAGAMRAAARDVRDAIEALRADGTLQAAPTFFEATTALAFELFRRAAVEVAVIEVGLGGRLDSTNVIDPVVTAITSIDFDHQQYLGSTLDAIAGEKAGIIKAGVPVVVGDLRPEAMAAIEAVARERQASIVPARQGVTTSPATSGTASANTFDLRTPARDYGTLTLSLRGDHQVANAIVAVRLLEQLDQRGVGVPAGAIREGLARVSWPGRLDHRSLPGGRELILDAAHNPAGAAALASYLRNIGGQRPVLVFGAMRDKDVHGMLSALLPTVSRMIVTRASNSRSADPETLAAEARTIAPSLRIEVVPTPAEAVSAAWSASSRVVVAGSIFLLGDVFAEIGA
ncbi:MAG TPA: folylpolyglutamate synthase/dihydrofolate synthase family protein [Vicinamibacterales bacterium]|nr:folylpolyglutamate synthase/dihydrofolate synthase family protein [Vicinamibacterales bacterium]